MHRGYFPFLNASGLSYNAALARRARSSFLSLSSLRSAASFLFLLASPFLLPPPDVSSPTSPNLCFPLLTQLQVPLILLLDLNVDPLLKITKQGRGLQNIHWLHNNHTFKIMTRKVLQQKKIHSHHQTNANRTKWWVEGIICAHPVPLLIRILFFRLGHLARIAAKAHWHRNSARQRQKWVSITDGDKSNWCP